MTAQERTDAAPTATGIHTPVSHSNCVGSAGSEMNEIMHEKPLQPLRVDFHMDEAAARTTRELIARRDE